MCLTLLSNLTLIFLFFSDPVCLQKHFFAWHFFCWKTFHHLFFSWKMFSYLILSPTIFSFIFCLHFFFFRPTVSDEYFLHNFFQTSIIPLIPWFLDSLIPWFFGSLIPRFLISLISWFLVSLIRWSVDSLIGSCVMDFLLCSVQLFTQLFHKYFLIFHFASKVFAGLCLLTMFLIDSFFCGKLFASFFDESFFYFANDSFIGFFLQSARVLVDHCDYALSVEHGEELAYQCAASTTVQLESAHCAKSGVMCQRFLDLTGPLYLGGLPETQVDSRLSSRFLDGCIRDFTLDERLVDMNDFIDESSTSSGTMTTVYLPAWNPINMYLIRQNKRPSRNKRPPKTVIFQRGEYTKPKGFWWVIFQRGEYTRPKGFWWVIFQRGEYIKPMSSDGFWKYFLLLLKIKHPGRLFW